MIKDVGRGYSDGPSAMARVAACEQAAGELSAGDGLHIAAYEGPRSHLLAGSTAGGPTGRQIFEIPRVAWETAFLLISICLFAMVVLVPFMRLVTPPKTPSADAH